MCLDILKADGKMTLDNLFQLRVRWNAGYTTKVPECPDPDR